MRSTWLNALLFQLVWLAAVIGAARDAWWPGVAATAVFAVVTLGFGDRARSDAQLVIVAMLLGAVLDSAWAASATVRYGAPVPSPALAPVWIVALWANFGLALDHSLAWLQPRPWLAAAFGAIGGPASFYFAARTWHAVTLAEPLWRTLALLALAWAVVTPLLARLAARFAARRATSTLEFAP